MMLAIGRPTSTARGAWLDLERMAMSSYCAAINTWCRVAHRFFNKNG